MVNESFNKWRIANVKLHAFERCRPIVYEDEIGRVEDPHAASAYTVTDGGRQNRMLHRERLEYDARDLRRRTLFDEMAFFDAANL